MSPPASRLTPEDVEHLVNLVAERLLARLDGRQPLSSNGEPARADVHLAALRAAALIDGPATVPELARRVRLRDETVRRLIQSDPAFVRVSPPPGRSPKAKCWALASEIDQDSRGRLDGHHR